jgi:NTE family protein
MKLYKFCLIFFLVLPVINTCKIYGVVDEKKFLTQYLWREVITLPEEKRPKIGLALGGGGARGFTHLGVLRVLEEEGFPVDIIVGTSIGALVGALYCSGISLDEIEKMAEDIGWSDLTDISIAALIKLLIVGEMLSTKKMEEYIAKHIGNKQFYELKIPFACVATDLRTGEKIIFREGNVSQAVRASANIPGIFAPVEYRHRLLVDGGLVDNIPTDLAKFLKADIIIAVDINSDFTRHKASNILLVLNQAIYIQGDLLSQEELKFADIVINPQVSDVDAYELGRYQECIDAGIIACRKMIPELKRLIMDTTFKWILSSE